MRNLRFKLLPFCMLAATVSAAFAQQNAAPSTTTSHKAARPTRPRSPRASGCGQQCGTERWPVKTLTDQDAGQVNFSPVEKTVVELTSIQAPARGAQNSRLDDTEKQTYKVRAKLVGFKLETDRDFHIVIADLQDPNTTMVVEIPDPVCSGVCSSPKLEEIKSAREKFPAPFPNAPPHQEFAVVQSAVEVEVTGVGFFDFAHNQTGLARNCVELHPVLDVHFIGQGPFEAKHDPAAQPRSHPRNWYKCIPKPPAGARSARPGR